MTEIVVTAIAVLVLAYAVWATRDVLLKRLHNDARMDALEAKCNKAIENLAKEMRDTILDLPQRVQRLEGNKVGGELLSATQNWSKGR